MTAAVTGQRETRRKIKLEGIKMKKGEALRSEINPVKVALMFLSILMIAAVQVCVFMCVCVS